MQYIVDGRRFVAHIFYIHGWNIPLSEVTFCLFTLFLLLSFWYVVSIFCDMWIVEKKEKSVIWFDEAGYSLHRGQGKKRELCRKRESWKARPWDEESCGSGSVRKEKLWKGLGAQDMKAWHSWRCRQCGCGMEQKITSVAEFFVENNAGALGIRSRLNNQNN